MDDSKDFCVEGLLPVANVETYSNLPWTRGFCPGR